MIINTVGYGIQYGYIPRGPESDITKQDLKILHNKAKKNNLCFIRIDPFQELNLSEGTAFKSSHSPQPECTRVINLTQSEEEILKQMKRKGRYNISLSQKKKLTLTEGRTAKDVKKFYQLLKLTTARDKFSGHSEDYYQKMIKNIPNSTILVISKNNKILAAMILIIRKPTSIYYYGASSHENRELMAAYLLQWEAMKKAKAAGCTSYDLLGIAPKDAPKNHPWKGITQFKNKFGGEEIHYPAAKDLIFKPFRYKLFLILKTIQRVLKRR